MNPVEDQPPLHEPDQSSACADPQSKKAAEDYYKLRSLLLGDDYSVALNHYISKEEDAERVADVLSEAVTLSVKENPSLGEALTPVVDKAIAKSIEENPSRITHAIYPIMGPAIRKAVSAALAEMVQSLNTLLEQSLTLGSMKWRFRAWRAGIPYAQFVLLQTIKYRVEQVLLVHRETGLLLQSVTAPEVKSQDPELISSMLTAISDFVSDSFSGGEETLERIRFGDLELHLLVGPKAILAVAVRGSASDELTEKASATIELIHSRFASAFKHFDGDRVDFDATQPLLSECLLSQKIAATPKRKPWLAMLLLLASAGYLLINEVERYRLVQVFNQVKAAYQQEPGYVLLSASRQVDQLMIEVLRSPESRPASIVHSTILKEPSVSVVVNEKIVHFGPLPTVEKTPARTLIDVESTVNALLEKDDKVSIIAQDDRLQVSGRAAAVTLARIQQSELLKGAFEVLDISGLKVIEPKSAQEMIAALAGEVQQTIFYFSPKEYVLTADELEKVAPFVRDIKALQQYAAQGEIKALQIVILGFADNSGTDFGNKVVSQQRAEMMRELLIKNGIDADIVVAWGAGNIDQAHISDASQRRVTVQVLYALSQKTNLHSQGEP
jgi:OOP family OmpA-OmpF porin